MLKVLIFVVPYLLWGCTSLTAGRSNTCNCGYGGLCINDLKGVNIPLPCSLCEDVSKGFYEDDCQTILNHCQSSPCIRGTCQPTFGGFYCKCPNSWTGKRCEIPTSTTDEFVTDNEVYVYYQVQPSHQVGRHQLTLVYNLHEQHKDDSSYVQISIPFSDGRIYFPSKSDFVLKNIKEECIRDALNNEELLDIGVCDYLPRGEVNTFTFDVFFSIAKTVPNADLVNIPDVGLIGRKGSITVTIQLKSSNGTTIRELHDQKYFIFSYFYETAKRCLVESRFVGCSTNVDKPNRYPREGKILLRAVSKVTNCEGVFVTGTEWFLQRHINPEDNELDKDFLPQSIGKNIYHLAFEPFTLPLGLHMFEFVYHFRGIPPYYGGTRSFSDYSRCWIVITSGDPILSTEGGIRRTMSCHAQMVLPLSNANLNFKLSEFSIYPSCNVTADVDCKRTLLSVPVLRKSTKAKCGSYYEYTFEVQFVTYETRFSSVRKSFSYKTVIHFITTYSYAVNILLECLFNCFPIDPSYKLLMYAKSHPYLPNPVKWSIFRGDTTVEIGDEVRAFLPLTASRILRLQGNKLVEDTSRASNISINVSYGPLVANIILVGDNLKYDGAMGYDIKFTDDKKTAVSIKVKSPGPLTFPEGTYSVFEVNKLAEDFLPVITTSYKEDLDEIILHWTSIRICLRDERHVEHCIDQQVEEGNIGLNRVQNMTEIKEAFVYKNVPLFLSNAVLYMIDSLVKTNKTYFTWPGNLEERLQILDFANKNGNSYVVPGSCAGSFFSTHSRIGVDSIEKDRTHRRCVSLG